MTIRHNDLAVDWLGYATLRIEGDDSVVYMDPGRYGVLSGEWEPHAEGIRHPPAQDYEAKDGDVVCVTHIHHYDPEGIRRVASDDATVVLFEGINVHDSDRDLDRPAELDYDVVTVSMEDELLANDVPIWTVPA
jgi:L-ascorbate metabolism protein UlaG (beta-lactamase superfamily)